MARYIAYDINTDCQIDIHSTTAEEAKAELHAHLSDYYADIEEVRTHDSEEIVRFHLPEENNTIVLEER